MSFLKNNANLQAPGARGQVRPTAAGITAGKAAAPKAAPEPAVLFIEPNGPQGEPKSYIARQSACITADSSQPIKPRSRLRHAPQRKSPGELKMPPSKTKKGDDYDKTPVKFDPLQRYLSEIREYRLLTREEVGERHGISRERVRQVEMKIIRRMRGFFRREIPDLASCLERHRHG